MTTFFAQRGFVQTHPPIITSSDCEGAGEVFRIATDAVPQEAFTGQDHRVADTEPFFRSSKYLTVSSQLHLEALAQSVGDVWALSPTFRAEKSDTPRHLSEFYMLEAEMCFVDNLDSLMDLVEEVVRAVGRNVRDSFVGKELLSTASNRSDDEACATISQDQLAARWEALIEQDWPRISYHNALKLLRQAVSRGATSFEFEPIDGSSLQAEHEKYLADVVGNGGPIFVTDYPRGIKAFYMAASPPKDNTTVPTVACFDLLVPELCEIVGGSIREHRLQHLLKNMATHGLLKHDGLVRDDMASKSVPRNLQWYVDLRRYGSVPHGGLRSRLRSPTVLPGWCL